MSKIQIDFTEDLSPYADKLASPATQEKLSLTATAVTRAETENAFFDPKSRVKQWAPLKKSTLRAKKTAVTY